MKKNIKISIEYDGTNYSGWQVQPNAITIQEVLQKAIKKITSEKTTIYGSGRTDAGVHAISQVANFSTSSRLNLFSLKKGLNSVLPKDISIIDAAVVSDAFDARFWAKKKQYRYKILYRPEKSPLYHKYSWHIPYELNLRGMRNSCKYLTGEHDFTAFSSSSKDVKCKVKNIYELTIDREGDFIVFNITGSGFLRYMVRIIVGTLELVGREKLKPMDIKKILESKDRKQAGMTAPPQGLFLVKVFY